MLIVSPSSQFDSHEDMIPELLLAVCYPSRFGSITVGVDYLLVAWGYIGGDDCVSRELVRTRCVDELGDGYTTTMSLSTQI